MESVEAGDRRDDLLGKAFHGRVNRGREVRRRYVVGGMDRLAKVEDGWGRPRLCKKVRLEVRRGCTSHFVTR